MIQDINNNLLLLCRGNFFILSITEKKNFFNLKRKKYARLYHNFLENLYQKFDAQNFICNDVVER